MRDFLVLFVHLLVTSSRLVRPGGLRSVVVESVLLRHQLLILNRGRKRAPNLCSQDRLIAGFCTLFIRRARLLRSAIVWKPSTLLNLHNVLKRRKYRLMFSPKRSQHPGPEGPTKKLVGHPHGFQQAQISCGGRIRPCRKEVVTTERLGGG
jgi:putative transposase